MAFNFVQGNHAATSGSSPITAPMTLGATVTSGNAVVVAVIYIGTVGAATITVADDKGNSYLPVDNAFSSGKNSIATFYLTNITNAPKTITATVTAFGGGTVSLGEVIADEYSGIGAGTLDGHNAQHATFTIATDNATSGTFATTADGDFIWGVISVDVTSTFAHGTGFTIGQNNVNDSATEYEAQTTHSASSAATFTVGTAGGFAVGAIALAPPGGPGFFITVEPTIVTQPTITVNFTNNYPGTHNP